MKKFKTKEDFLNTKIRVTPTQSRELQEYLFSLGLSWANKSITVDCYSSYLFIEYFITHSLMNDGKYFQNHENTEIFYEDIFPLTMPKYWAVLNDYSDLFKETVIKDVNNLKSHNQNWMEDFYNAYYGYDGSSTAHGYRRVMHINSFENNPAILTLKQYCRLTNRDELGNKFEEEFVFPKKWCIKRDKKNYKIINEWCNSNFLPDEHSLYCNYMNYIYSEEVGSVSYLRISDYVKEGFAEITFEQFQKYILNKPIQNPKSMSEPYNENEEIIVKKELLIAMYKACTEEQEAYMTAHFNGFTGETTKKHIKGLYELACIEWKPKFEQEWPWVTETKYPVVYNREWGGFATSQCGITTNHYCLSHHIGILPTRPQSKAMNILCILLMFRAKWLEAEGYDKDWVPKIEFKTAYGIKNMDNKLIIMNFGISNMVLIFPSQDMAEKFLNEPNFKQYLEDAKIFL